MKRHLSEFEHAIIEKIIQGCVQDYKILSVQLENCQVSGREMTGCGFFTELEVDRSMAQPVVGDSTNLSGVGAKIPGLRHGAGFVLFLKGGYFDFLEGFSYEELWPSSIEKFELFLS